MNRRLPILLAIGLAAALALMLRGGGAAKDHAFMGYVEGDLLYVAPNEGERLESLAVEAGASVAKGDPLFALATPVLDEQRRQAQARVSQMEAQLQNMQEALSRPQQVAVLQAAVERAQAALTLSEADYQRQKALFAHGDVARAALDRAEMARDRDKASLAEARRQITVGRMAGRDKEIAAAEAALAQARAQLGELDIRLARQKVAAPEAGVVQDIFLRPGEIVAAGQAVLSLLPPGNRKVRFYAPEPRLVETPLGARVKIACDGCPDNVYGRVFYVSGREEYTPPVIFSDDERAKLVFKIEARLEDRARAIPLGLPVRVTPAPQAAAK
jgi:HlyD family secretion protein